MTTSTNSLEKINSYADYWRYEIGANVIPADTRFKRTYIQWGQWQDKLIPEELHNQWKLEEAFSNGMAVILGRVWHRQVCDLANYYLVGVDADNKKAIEEICTRGDKTTTLQEFAATTLVEQHKDNPYKAHFYFYTRRSIRGKSSNNALLGDKISINEIPAIEIKSLGSHGILYCSPSVHKDGQAYEIIGTDKPAMLDDLQTTELENHFDKIFSKYGIEYLSSGITGKAKLPITELFKPGHKVLKGHNRHEDLLRVMESLISRNRDILSLEEIKNLARKHNTTDYYEEALDDIELEKQWNCAVRFIESKNETDAQVTELTEDPTDERTRVQKLVDSIMQEHIFVTMTDNGELYHFNGKIYESGQEWMIKEKCRLLESKTTSHEVQEVINYIKDSTYKNRSIFDSNPDLLVVENGILNIHTLELTAHTPEHYALSILPVHFDRTARCPQFSKFLSDILNGKRVNTMLQFIGYCLYKSAKYEKAALFIGKGDNGKSTLLNALDRFFGRQNISHASLQDLSGGNRFAAADLNGKMINTFADLRKDKLQDTGPFKMLVSGDWIRAERKYGQPFTFQNHAKLIFSCNTIPQSEDEGYAYFKRWLIFHFERSFTGEERDNKLIDKITTPEEQSGLLNLVLIFLRQLLKDNEFSEAGDIETVQQDYELNSNTVMSFVNEICEITKNDEDDDEDIVVCRDLYDEYTKYCKATGITVIKDNIFGSELALLHIKRYRRRVRGSLEYVYSGIKLKSVPEREASKLAPSPSSSVTTTADYGYGRLL
jgi:P4 family phage/plasmid primase-like protien